MQQVPVKPKNLLQTPRFNSNINVLQDAYQDLPEAIVNNYICSYYQFSTVGLQCKKDNYTKFLEHLQTHYDVKEYKFEIRPNNRMYYLENTDKTIFVIADSEQSDIYGISIFSIDLQTSQTIYEVFKKFEHIENDTIVNFNTLSVGQNGKVSEYNIQYKLADFSDDSPLFYPYLDTDELFRQFTISDENILVISGAPGTGKTRAANLYIKYLLENEEICLKCGLYENDNSDSDKNSIGVCYVKNEELLSTDGLWEILTIRRPAIVFLDDSDHSLTSRNNEVLTNEDHLKNKFLSQLLSFTDGVTKNNVKFIITTNLPVEAIDTAVLRKGRTFDILRFQTLSHDEAMHIWIESGLVEKNFYKYFSDDESFIPACDLGSNISKEKAEISSGIQNRTYVLRDGISILNKTSKKVNQGFFG